MDEKQTIEMENAYVVSDEETSSISDDMTTTTNEDVANIDIVEATESEYTVDTTSISSEESDNEIDHNVMIIELVTGNTLSQNISDANWKEMFTDQKAIASETHTIVQLIRDVMMMDTDTVSETLTSYIDASLDQMNLNTVGIAYNLRDNMTEREVALMKLMTLYQVLTKLYYAAAIFTLADGNGSTKFEELDMCTADIVVCPEKLLRQQKKS